MTTTTQTAKVSQIHSAGNVRREVGNVRELAYSIERWGILNPLTVRANGSGFELIAGHRRLAAAKELGLKTVPVFVLDYASGDAETDAAGERIALQLVENLQRADLTPLEEGEAIAELVELLGSQKAAAEAIGRSQAHVSKRLKVRELPDVVGEALAAGSLNLEDAYELTKIDSVPGVKRALKGLTEKGTRWDLDKEVERTERDKVSRKAARDVSKQKHRQNVEVVARPDMPAGWKTLEGWDGLAVDQDAHEAEPCHRLVVGYRAGWSDEVSEEYFCADQDRHGPEGESELKAPTHEDKAADVEAREAERVAKIAALEEVAKARGAEALRIAAGVQDRNTALKVLARFILSTLDAPGDFLEALGAKGQPEEPQTRSWEDREGWEAYGDAFEAWVDAQPIATLYRAAVLYVLTQTTHDVYDFDRAKPIAASVAELLGVDVWQDPTED